VNILIIGATRGIGLRLLQEALRRGHEVTALARAPGKLSIRHARLRVLKGDILDLSSVELASAGQDAVCCTVGIRPTRKPVTVFSEGTKNVLEAMKRHDVRLLVCVTGIGAGDSRGHGGFLYDRIFQPFLLRRIYEDKDRQEELIMAGELDWVIVRPGFLTNGPETGHYRVITDLRGVKAGSISRADVAHFMLGQLESPEFLRRTPLLMYG
jgi:putative NADH-flavin reductase